MLVWAPCLPPAVPFIPQTEELLAAKAAAVDQFSVAKMTTALGPHSPTPAGVLPSFLSSSHAGDGEASGSGTTGAASSTKKWLPFFLNPKSKDKASEK